MSKTFLIADMHIGHKNTIKMDKRPFDSVEQMDEEIVHRWNSVVGEDDTTIIVGDAFWKYRNAKEVLPKLNGRKVLVVGNHDQVILKNKDLMNEFDEIHDYLELQHGEWTVCLSHYPMFSYNKNYLDRTIHFYGHVHNTQDEYIVRTAQKMGLETFAKKIVKSCGSGWKLSDGFGLMLNVGCMQPWMDYTPRTIEELIPQARLQLEEVKSLSYEQLHKMTMEHSYW